MKGDEMKAPDGYEIEACSANRTCECRMCHHGDCQQPATFAVSMILDQGQTTRSKPANLCAPCLTHGLGELGEKE